MTKQSLSKRNYPWATTLGGKQINLRLMQPDDRDSLLAFARSLPADDLLFLSMDITEPVAVEVWVKEIEAGRSVTILAESDGAIVGHGTLNCNNLTWSRHLGEIQLLISPNFRGKGLGNLLADEINSVARTKNLQKLVARMAAEQQSAKQVFERLGFNAEALLADYMIDRQGRTHDLIIMSYDVTGLNV